MPLDVLLTVAGLALLDTLSPAIFGISIYLLVTGSANTGRLMAVYLATVALFYFGLGAALVLGLEAVLTRVGDLMETRAAFWVQAVIGAALFVGSWFVPTTRRAGATRRPRAHTAGAMVGLGVATGAAEAALALPYLGAIGILASADLPSRLWVPVLVGYNLVMVLPGVLLYLGWRLLGEWLRPRLERWRDKVANGSREAMAWIIGIAGFLILRDAVYRLGGFDWLVPAG